MWLAITWVRNVPSRSRKKKCHASSMSDHVPTWYRKANTDYGNAIANERTFLAYLRTSLATISTGIGKYLALLLLMEPISQLWVAHRIILIPPDPHFPFSAIRITSHYPAILVEQDSTWQANRRKSPRSISDHSRNDVSPLCGCTLLSLSRSHD